MEVGDIFPKFKLADQDGNVFDSGSLEGKPAVVYFYPRDNTSGCTKEALGFNALLSDFEALGVKVIGVSADSVASHRKFADKHGLNFTLVSDPDKVLIKGAGAWGPKKLYGKDYEGIIRSTFLVGADGKVAAAWKKVKVDGHAQAVLDAASAL